MGTRVTFRLEGTGEIQPDGSMRVIGVLNTQPTLPVPGQVQNLRLVSLGSGEVELTWDAATDATGYEIFRDDVLLDTAADLDHVDSTVEAATTYRYRVRATNSSGEGELSNELTVEVPEDALPVPAAPLLTLVRATSSLIEFSWDAVPNAVSYKVLDGVTLLDTITATGFVHSGLTPESAHSYTVIATNATGDSDPSDALVISTAENRPPLWGDTTTPIALTVGDSFSLDLNTLCEDQDEDPITYTLESGAFPDGLSLAGSVVSGTVTADGSFAPVIRADDGFDTSDAEFAFEVAELVDTTPPTTPVLGTPIVTGSTVTVPMVTPSEDASGILQYTVSRRVNGTGGFQIRATLASHTDFPYIESSVPDGFYEYRVRARDASPAQLVSEFSNVVEATVAVGPPAPDTPINFTATQTGPDSVQISWAPGPSSSAPTGYDLEYSIEANGGSSTGPWTDFVVSGTVTSANQSGIPTGRVWYRIRALNGAAASGYTSVISVLIGSGETLPATFRITLGTTEWDGSVARTPLTGGSARPVGPGDVVEFVAGTYRAFTMRNVIGSAQNPVLIRVQNGGQVIFRKVNPSTGGFLTNWRNCRHFIVDGFTTSGSVPQSRDGKRHGFKCMWADNATTGNKDGPTAYVKFSGSLNSPTSSAPYTVTRNCTFRYWHFDFGWDATPSNSLNTDAGNIAFSSNDHKYKRAWYSTGSGASYTGPWQESMIFEHFLAENLGGEATYIGPNPYMSVRGTGSEAGGPDVPVRYVKLRHFMTYNTGGQPIQGKSWFGGFGGGDGPTENSVHDGVIILGTSKIGDATNGTPAIILNSCKADIYNMWIERCGGGAITIQTGEGTNVGFPDVSTTFRHRIYNCVLIDNNRLANTYNGIRVAAYTGSPTLPVAYRPEVHAFCNTIVRHNPSSGSGSSIRFESSAGAGSTIRNNIVLDSTAISAGPAATSGNLQTTNDALFIDTTGTYLGENINLRLSGAQAAVSAELPSPSLARKDWPTSVNVPLDDLGGTARSAGTATRGAYEYIP